MTDDTAQRLQEIEARHAASTPGEWVEVWNGSFCEVVAEDHFEIVVGDCLQSNAKFIAHAHQDVPFLLAEIKRMKRRINQLESSIGEPMLDQIDGRSRPGFMYTVKP